MEIAFYFMFYFISKDLTFLSSIFGYVEKQLDEKAMVNFKMCD